jgi:hypothetical protein
MLAIIFPFCYNTYVKHCSKCGLDKPRDEFYTKSGMCKPCHVKHNSARRLTNIDSAKAYDRARYESLWRERAVDGAKRRAVSAGLPFDITVNDVVIPSTCPVLGIPIFITRGLAGSNAPSLDRIKPELGYVKGNVIVVSWRANRLRSDAQSSELRLISDFYSQLGQG